MRVETEEPVAVLERLDDGVADLAVFHDGSLVAQVARPAADLPNPDPEPGCLYVADLDDGTPVSLSFAPDLTERYRRPDTVQVDLVERVEFVRSHVPGEGDGGHRVRVEFTLDRWVGRHDYACHAFCKADGATAAARRAARGYHFDPRTHTTTVTFPLAPLVADLTDEVTPERDRGVVADVAVLVLQRPARGAHVAGTPFDPTWTPPTSDQYDLCRVDRVLLDTA